MYADFNISSAKVKDQMTEIKEDQNEKRKVESKRSGRRNLNTNLYLLCYGKFRDTLCGCLNKKQRFTLRGEGKEVRVTLKSYIKTGSQKIIPKADISIFSSTNILFRTIKIIIIRNKNNFKKLPLRSKTPFEERCFYQLIGFSELFYLNVYIHYFER